MSGRRDTALGRGGFQHIWYVSQSLGLNGYRCSEHTHGLGYIYDMIEQMVRRRISQSSCRWWALSILIIRYVLKVIGDGTYERIWGSNHVTYNHLAVYIVRD